MVAAPEPDADPGDAPFGEPAAVPDGAPDAGEPVGEPTVDEDAKELETEALLADVPLARGFVWSTAEEPAAAPAPAPSPDTCAMFPGGTTSRSVMGML